jgi:hypothetical protein
MTVSGFFASALEVWVISELLLGLWLIVTVSLVFLGEWRRKRRRKVAIEEKLAQGSDDETRIKAELALIHPRGWVVPLCLLGLAGVLLVAAAWGAGLVFRYSGPVWLLRVSVLACTVFVLWREGDWVAQHKDLRVVPFWKRVKHISWLLVLMATFVLASFLLDEPIRSWLLWSGLVGLMLFLELAESTGGLDLRCPLSFQWRLWVLAIALLTCGAWIVVDWQAWTGFLFAASLLLLGWCEPIWRIERTTEHIHEMILRDQNILDARPSLIAHSLGTFLSGESFEVYDLNFRLSFDRILFVGAAISEEFDWEPYLQANRIHHIRNEYGGMDVVINLLRLSGSWAHQHGLGGAGFYGLLPPLSRFHNVSNHRIACLECIDYSSLARVHNYFLKRFRHSTGTLRKDHAFAYWLPYLWGHSPEDWHSFLEGCRDLFRAWGNRECDPKKYREGIKDLQQRTWNWDRDGYGKKPLTTYVCEEIAPHLQLLDHKYPNLMVSPSQLVQDAAAVKLCLAVAKALLWPKTDASVIDLKLLIPLVAIREAALEAYKEVASRLDKGERPISAGFEEPCQTGIP